MPKQVFVINPIGGAMQDKLPVAAYCRVSSNSDDQRHSYYAQVKEYTEQIEGNPEWTLAGIYADPGITGTSAAKRKEFQRLMKDCRAGKVKRILVKSVSRFARNTKECLEYVRELKMLGVSVYFEDKKIDTASYSSEMMLAMFGSIAQEESLSISSNMRWSYEKRMQAGEFITCFAPYGYRMKNNILGIFEPEAKIVRWIYQQFLNGIGRYEIAQLLTKDSIPTPSDGTTWQSTVVGYILKNEKYAGNALTPKRYTSDVFSRKRIINTGERPQYLVEDSHPAIVSPEDYQKVQQLIGTRTAKTISVRQDHILRGKIQCKECGNHFKRKVRSKDTIRWVCSNHDTSKDICPTLPIDERLIVSSFLRMLGLLRASIDTILLPMTVHLQRISTKSVMGNEDANAISNSIMAINGQIHALNRLRSKGFMEPAAFQEKQNELAAQLQKAQKQREMLLSDDKDDQSLERTEELMEIIAHAPESLASLEDGEVFSMMVAKVLIDRNKKIIFRLINGLELIGDGGNANG